MERLSVREHERIAELVAAGAPFWRLRQEVPRSRFAIYRAVKRITRAPVAEPNRSLLRLSMAEREEISRGLAAGESLRAIAGRLCRAPSTVSREVARNGGRGRYRAANADRVAVRNMCRPKVAKLARCHRLRAVVEAKLELRWSPQQIDVGDVHLPGLVGELGGEADVETSRPFVRLGSDEPVSGQHPPDRRHRRRRVMTASEVGLDRLCAGIEPGFAQLLTDRDDLVFEPVTDLRW